MDFSGSQSHALSADAAPTSKRSDWRVWPEEQLLSVPWRYKLLCKFRMHGVSPQPGARDAKGFQLAWREGGCGA